MSIQRETNAKGVIRVININKTKLKVKELIHIGLLLKSNKSIFNIDDWQNEIKKHDPIGTNFEYFSINKKEWLTSAKIFIVPTLTFGQTKIEIYLKEHAMLGTGFTVELFHRNGSTTKIFKNDEIMTTSFGGLINIQIEWHIQKTDLPQIELEQNEENDI